MKLTYNSEQGYFYTDEVIEQAPPVEHPKEESIDSVLITTIEPERKYKSFYTTSLYVDNLTALQMAEMINLLSKNSLDIDQLTKDISQVNERLASSNRKTLVMESNGDVFLWDYYKFCDKKEDHYQIDFDNIYNRTRWCPYIVVESAKERRVLERLLPNFRSVTFYAQPYTRKRFVYSVVSQCYIDFSQVMHHRATDLTKKAIYTLFDIPDYLFEDNHLGLSQDMLVEGNLYSYRSTYQDNITGVFRYSKDRASQKCVEFSDSAPLFRYYYLDDLLYKRIIKPATYHETEVFKSLQAYQIQKERQERIERRLNRIQNKKRKKRMTRKEQDHDLTVNYNKDTATQLLSSSLHEAISKSIDNKVARCLLRLNKLGYLKDSLRNVTIRRSDKEMTFCPSGKDTEITDNGNWDNKGRQNGKYGKIIRKILTEQVPKLKFKDVDIENLVNSLKSYYDFGQFKEVSGEDIRYWYHYENTYSTDENEVGTLMHSCMRHSSCQAFLDIYVKNPSVVKLIILLKDNKILGRALLWNDKFMDRIYGTDSTFAAFKKYAKDKGYYYKAKQNSESDEYFVNPETGEKSSIKIDVELEVADLDYYPYADTLCYLDINDKMLRNYEEGDYCYLRETDGSTDREDRIYDEIDDRFIDEDDACYVEHAGFYTHVDNTYYSERRGESILIYDAVETVNGDFELLNDCIELHDGRYAYQDDAIYCDGDDVYCAEGDDYYGCEYDYQTYLEDRTPSVYIEELSMTVAEQNVECAYKEAGYEQVDGEWKLIEETEE